jgi:hypothetical protein
MSHGKPSGPTEGQKESAVGPEGAERSKKAHELLRRAREEALRDYADYQWGELRAHDYRTTLAGFLKEVGEVLTDLEKAEEARAVELQAWLDEKHNEVFSQGQVFGSAYEAGYRAGQRQRDEEKRVAEARAAEARIQGLPFARPATYVVEDAVRKIRITLTVEDRA